MKHLSEFNNFMKTLVESNVFDVINKSFPILKESIKNIFSLFKTSDDIAKFEKYDDELIKLVDIYDFLTDINVVFDMTDSDILEYAKNLGIEDEQDIIHSLLSKIYKDKYKRNFKSDINLCISALKNNTDNSEKEDKFIIKNLIEILNKIEKNF
jgi:hypothetical protein